MNLHLLRRQQRSGNGRQGLTLLLEVLLGLTLVTLVLLVIFQLFPVADRSVSLADRTTHANYLARALMEERLDSPYADLSPGVLQGEFSSSDHTRRRGSSLSTEFVYRVEVELADPAVEVKDITVTVSWKEGARDETRGSSVSLQSARGNLW